MSGTGASEMEELLPLGVGGVMLIAAVIGALPGVWLVASGAL
jgi:hypothetical protein